MERIENAGKVIQEAKEGDVSEHKKKMGKDQSDGPSDTGENDGQEDRHRGYRHTDGR